MSKRILAVIGVIAIVIVASVCGALSLLQENKPAVATDNTGNLLQGQMLGYESYDYNHYEKFRYDNWTLFVKAVEESNGTGPLNITRVITRMDTYEQFKEAYMQSFPQFYYRDINLHVIWFCIPSYTTNHSYYSQTIYYQG